MFSFFFKSRKKVAKLKVGDWVTTNKNVYGKYLHCQIVRIYKRGRQWHNTEWYCALEFQMDGKMKRINASLKSCKLI